MHCMSLCSHASVCVCVSACMRACVYVCACMRKNIYDAWTLLGYCRCERAQHLSLLWNGGHQQSDNTAVLSNTHIQYIHTDWMWRQNNKKNTYFQTRWDTVALLTLYENLVFWMVTSDYCKKKQSFHIVAVCSELIMFLKNDTWFLRSALFFFSTA